MWKGWWHKESNSMQWNEERAPCAWQPASRVDAWYGNNGVGHNSQQVVSGKGRQARTTVMLQDKCRRGARKPMRLLRRRRRKQ